MNPQYLQIPQPTAGMVIGSVIGVMVLLGVAIFLGAHGKGKMEIIRRVSHW